MQIKFKCKFLLSLVMCIICGTGFSQDFINEDFLDNIEKNATGMWGENIAAFTSNAVPAKYKNESAVVMGFKRNVTIDKKSRMGFLSKGERSLMFFENVRFKIELNDKSSVQEFTTIYFRYADKEDGFSARVIKPDGSKLPVSLNEAVGIESSARMPEFFKSFFDQQSGAQRRYYKVAIPDLEPGDILEYVTVTKNKLNVAYTGNIEFTPQYELCNKGYPILFNQITIDTDGKTFFKSLSLNGAPDFKKEPSDESGFFRYVFTDYDRGVEKDVNFINAYREYPLVKFQVIYANNEKAKGTLIGEKGEIKSGFSKEELAKKAWEDYAATGDTYYDNYLTVQKFIDNLWAGLKKLGAKDWSEKDYINNVYYRLRNVVVNRDNYLSDKTAAFIFGSLLYQRDIKSELVISISNNIGNLKEVLFEQEIRYVCKVNDKLYFNCTDFSNPQDLVENLAGSEAYIISEPAKGGVQEIKTFVLPNSIAADNVSNYTINASLTGDMNTLLVSKTSAYKGLSKSRYIPDALKYTPYMLTDYKYYGGNSPTEKMKDAQEEEYSKSVKALQDNFKEAKPDFVKSQLQSEFGQKVKYKNFTIHSDGRSVKASELNFTEEFELSGMLRKAGKKYLVNIPGLVGSQLQIKKEERIRKHDINVGYPRSLSWVINFKIPAGYTAEGLQELKSVNDNEAGTYICEAIEKDGNVVLNIKKQYKQAQMPKDKWNDLLLSLDAAFNNSFKYILLKPKN